MVMSNAEMLTLARELPIPVPWDINLFIDNLAELRGRPITLIPTDTAALADSPCGLWLTRDTDDLIMHEIGTSDYHISTIIAHEVGHMVLGHGHIPQVSRQGDKRELDELARQLLPDIDPATIRAVLGRTDYASEQERDAEMFASMLMIAAAEAAAQKSMMRSVFFRSR